MENIRRTFVVQALPHRFYARRSHQCNLSETGMMVLNGRTVRNELSGFSRLHLKCRNRSYARTAIDFSVIFSKNRPRMKEDATKIFDDHRGSVFSLPFQELFPSKKNQELNEEFPSKYLTPLARLRLLCKASKVKKRCMLHVRLESTSPLCPFV